MSYEIERQAIARFIKSRNNFDLGDTFGSDQELTLQPELLQSSAILEPAAQGFRSSSFDRGRGFWTLVPGRPQRQSIGPRPLVAWPGVLFITFFEDYDGNRGIPRAKRRADTIVQAFFDRRLVEPGPPSVVIDFGAADFAPYLSDIRRDEASSNDLRLVINASFLRTERVND